MPDATELQEFPIRGPFGGIQSQISPDDIEDVGFYDVGNIIFRDGKAWSRPGFVSLPPFPGAQENCVGFADFFNTSGIRVQTAITPTRLLNYASGAFTVVAGGPLTGTVTQLFATAIVNQKLLFSQGVDPVQLYDGVNNTFAPASGSAVPANFLMELATHLILGYTIETTPFTQRIRWTGAGDPTDFTSFNAGVNDLLNDLGPITGLAKLYQTGYALQTLGITQIIPTGIGTSPFAFVPLSSRAHGNIAPRSVAIYGETLVFYVGKDNIYMFDGTISHPVGDQPMEGRKRIGARTRILADLAVANLQAVVGYVTIGVNGNDFNAYLLSIPGIALWVYNIDEQNWSRLTYNQTILTIGTFFSNNVVRIIDLQGTIAHQQWSPATLIASNPFDGIGISFADDPTTLGNEALLGYTDFTAPSEQPWFITSGQHLFKDPSHQKTVKKFRLSVLDNGPATFTITVTGISNTLNSTVPTTIAQTKTITIGSGTGLVLKKLVDFSVPGDYIRWQVSGPPSTNACMVEFCPFFNQGGENRNN